MPHPLRALACALALVVVACSGGPDDPGAERAAPGTPSTTTTTTNEPPSSTTTTTPGLRLAGPLPATDGCPAVPAMAAPWPDRPQYRLAVDVRPDERLVVGAQAVRFTPDLPTDRLVLRLWPNGPRPAAAGARLEVRDVAVDGRPATVERPDATTIVIPLDRPLDAGEPVDVDVPWRLTLPGSANDRLAVAGGAVRLGSFFPVLAWEPGVGWATDPPTSAFAESSMMPVADFDVAVTVPAGLSVLASGEAVEPGRWRATAMRDVAVSVGRFQLVEGVAHAPEPVQVTVGVHEGTGESPQAYLDKVVQSLEDFGRRFGAYPWTTFSLSITPGLGGGIEYPGHVMQGPDTLVRTTSHEVGHMWFYALVGNNQGRDPWLDEGLASYAEARFEGTLESFRTRTIPVEARGRTGEPMVFWEQRQDVYYRGVYVQGAVAVASLAPPDAVDCALRHYVAENAFAVARPADLVESLRVVAPDVERGLAPFGLSP